MNGRIVIAALFLMAVVVGVITYKYVPSIVVPYYMEKPGQTEEFFDTIEAALLVYRTDHGAFPPEESLSYHRRHNKNLTKTRVPGVTTYRWALLTTPISYLDPLMPGDPYAVPEQFSPPGYVTGSFADTPEWALLFSPGPNLKFDTRPGEIRSLRSLAELQEYLTINLYDPTNGLRGGGDFHRLVVPGDH